MIAIWLTKEEIQALLDSIDTLDGAGITAVTDNIEVYHSAIRKLQRARRKAK